MSHAPARERRRRARLAAQVAEFTRARDGPEALAAVLARIAAGPDPVWKVADAAAADRPLDGDELALVARAAAPHLRRPSPRSVRERV